MKFALFGKDRYNVCIVNKIVTLDFIKVLEPPV